MCHTDGAFIPCGVMLLSEALYQMYNQGTQVLVAGIKIPGRGNKQDKKKPLNGSVFSNIVSSFPLLQLKCLINVKYLIDLCKRTCISVYLCKISQGAIYAEGFSTPSRTALDPGNCLVGDLGWTKESDTSCSA